MDKNSRENLVNSTVAMRGDFTGLLTSLGSSREDGKCKFAIQNSIVVQCFVLFFF